MKTKSFFIVIILTACISCEKDLDQTPISSPSASNFYRNTADFQQAVAGLYQALHNPDYGVSHFDLSEVRSDNIYSPGTSGVRDWIPINNFERAALAANHPIVSAAWNGDYNGILRANNILDKLNATVVPDNATRDRMEGEAKFFRAFFHFDLVRWFGKVPIFDHVATPTEALTIPRSPVADVYQLIVSDLQTAITKLPPRSAAASERGRATTDAAKGMLALVYLTRSGPTYNIEGPGLGTNDYAAALTLLNEIITGNRYSLQPTYASVFSYTNENNSEIVFDMQNVDPGTTADAGLGTQLPSAMYEGAYANAVKIGFAGGVDVDAPKLPSNNLRATFEAADTRDDFSILPSYTDLNGNFVNRAQFVKFLDISKKPLIRFNFAINFPILRYADILLMKAEAILRGAAGTQAEVDALVKQVRDRAGLTGSVLTNVTLDQLLAERRREFIAEGKRWHDLVRTGKVLTVMAAFDASDDVSNKMNPITANDIIYPLSQSQLSVSPGLYTQNPGY